MARRRRLTRQESAERTRALLLVAARKVFPARGYYASSLEQVADEAGFSRGAVYSRFENKADLFHAMLESVNDDRVRAIEEQVASAESVEEVIAAVKTWWLSSRDPRPREQRPSEPGFTLALVEYWAWASHDRATIARVTEEHERRLRAVADAIDAAVERLGGRLPYASLDLVRLLSALARGLALERQVSASAVDADFGDWVFDVVLTQVDRRAQTGRAGR